MSESVAEVRLFPGECCFQVIYFVSNIFFSPPSPNGASSPHGNHPVNACG
jgi:hypothetical protein